MRCGVGRYCFVHVEVHSECDVQLSACAFLIRYWALRFALRFLAGLNLCSVQRVPLIVRVEYDLIKLISRATKLTRQHDFSLF